MAHDPETRQRARALYIYERLPWSEIKRRLGVSAATLRRWKSDAANSGDDWDKARVVASMMGQGNRNIVLMLVEDFVVLHQSVMDDIKASQNLKPQQKVQMLAMLADAFTKTMNAAGRASPEVSKLAVAQDVILRLGEFIVKEFPEYGDAFIEILEPFGKQLSKSYG